MGGNGHLHEKHRGVYAVGHREITIEARWLAAVKACGKEAVLSHYAAAALWGLVDWDGRRIDVTAPTTRRHPGINTHRTTRPDRDAPSQHPGHVRAAHAGRPLLDAAVHGVPARGAAGVQPTPASPPHKQPARSRSSSARIAADIVPTESVLEDYVHDLIREAGFDEPLVNVPLGPYKPDFRWPHRGLIVEADGAGTHDNDLARHDDAVRTEHLPDRVVRVTWKQAVRQPAKTVARLRAEERATRPPPPR